MDSREQYLNDLSEVLRRLGPSRQLCVDRRELCAFATHLGEPIAHRVRTARDFAEAHECGFVYDEKAEHGIFFRAYVRANLTSGGSGIAFW